MPLLWLSLTFICGVVTGAAWRISSLAWVSLISVCSIIQGMVWFIRRRQPNFMVISENKLKHLPLKLQKVLSAIKIPVSGYVLLICFALGGWRFQAALPENTPEFIGWYNDRYREMIIEGVLIKPAEKFDAYQRLQLKAEKVRTPAESQFTQVFGDIYVYVTGDSDWRYGDRLQVQGSLNAPPSDSDFSYEAYLYRREIYSLMPYAKATLLSRGNGNPLMAAIYSLKSKSLAMLYQLFPDPEASLLAGILLGVESNIPEDVYQAFRQTGTAHIIVISGFNITILAGLFSTVFGRLLGRWRGALVSTLAIGLYTILVGAEAAVVRAAIMGGLSLYACQLGRRQTGINSLAFVAAIMALFSPHILWDVGFQLSFAATLGLVLYADAFTQWITRLLGKILPPSWVEKAAGWIGEYLLFTIAAQIMTLPIILYYFHNLSLVSLLANPVILPVQPFVMTLGGVALCLGLLWQPVGQVVGYLTWPFVAYTIRCVEWFASFQGGWLPVSDISLWVIWLYYGILLFLTFGGMHHVKIKKAIKPGLVVACLSLVTILVWQTVFTGGDGKLHLTVLDVCPGNTSGEALLIKTPGGRNILINSGPDTRALSQALGRRMPVVQSGLDWLIVAEGSERQLNTLVSLIQRHPPQNVLWAGRINASSASRQVSQRLSEMNIKISPGLPGQKLDLGEGAQLQILTVSSHGGVFLLTWGNFRALLPLGLDLDTVRWLNTAYQDYPVDVFLLANNGHILFNPPAFIQKIQPRLVVLSVAAADNQGLPSPHILDTVADYSFFRTDQDGWIHITTDGEKMWVEAGRR